MRCHHCGLACHAFHGLKLPLRLLHGVRLGHKTESVYRRYAIVAEQDLRDGVAKLAALPSTGTRTALPFGRGTKGAQSAGGAQ